MDKRNLVIAIDGPAGAGKSTVAKMLAARLGLTYLDTGAMYRVLAYRAQEAGFGPLDGAEAAHLGQSIDISFGFGDPQMVFANGIEVTDKIRSPEVGQLASELSSHSAVRRVLVERQQRIVAKGGVVLEGRDVTTVVAPHAQVKVYLTASLEERSKRRLVEFQTKGLSADFSKVREAIEERDHRDITRDDSPLMVAPEAKVIDSANRTAEEVAEMIEALAVAALEASAASEKVD